MDIERLLDITQHADNEKEVIGMIISNRIDYFINDAVGAAVTAKNFSALADDFLKWHKSKLVDG
jgi:hypothetical protein